MSQQLTPNYQFPYYQGSDLVDGPTQQQALAQKLDTVIKAAAPSSVLAAAPVLDVGMVGQIRAGRQLTVADFTNLGLIQPTGLWNLSGGGFNLGSVGSAGTVVNAGTILADAGINGVASTCVLFPGYSGSPTQALYVINANAGGMQLTNGLWGCWFRTAKRGVAQTILSKWSLTSAGWRYDVGTANTVVVSLSSDGTAISTLAGVSDVADDRWHFAVVTHDLSTVRLYIDGVLEGALIFPFRTFTVVAPFNIGAYGGNVTTIGAQPFFGRIDEAFTTLDVLSEDQIRCLYAAKLTHTLGVTPTDIRLNVHRLRKGAPLVVGDFTTSPLRLYNFTASDVIGVGSDSTANRTLAAGATFQQTGADGFNRGAPYYPGTTSNSATDTGLPDALTPRSYGCWFKMPTGTGGNYGIISWGALPASRSILYVSIGQLCAVSAADQITGPTVNDGQWHFAVVIEDNAAVDGIKRKLYLDGRLVGGSTVMGTITLAGATRFRIGSDTDGTLFFTGQIDTVFVCGHVMTQDEVSRIYAKGSQDLGVSPKNPGDHVERMDSSSLLFIGDTLESQHTIDLGVAV